MWLSNRLSPVSTPKGLRWGSLGAPAAWTKAGGELLDQGWGGGVSCLKRLRGLSQRWGTTMDVRKTPGGQGQRNSVTRWLQNEGPLDPFLRLQRRIHDARTAVVWQSSDKNAHGGLSPIPGRERYPVKGPRGNGSSRIGQWTNSLRSSQGPR